MNEIIDRTDINRAELLGSLLRFTQVMYRARTNRLFNLSYPDGRESHYITICRALTRVLRGEVKRLIINVPPRYGKSELLIHFVSWALAHFPDSNYIYVSYSHSLAKKQTHTVRSILQMMEYQNLFNVRIKDDTSAKDNFETTQGGSVYAAGAQGSITGRGAGIKGISRFGGCVVIDDIHKPDEVTSDIIRNGINEWFYNTLRSRVNDPSTPIIFIGQRLHEDDLAANLIKTKEWETLVIPAIDAAGNALHKEMHDLMTLRKMEKESPYNFSSQYQQDPQPAGGGIFKPEWFSIEEYEPNIITTFITIDTAETDKSYNDATVFSLWGIYKIKNDLVETDINALHWMDCEEIRIEPKDLTDAFKDFYRHAMHNKVKPSFIGIEKKSTGVTLSSILKTYKGLQVIDIERTKASGNKTARFLEAQPYVSRGMISLPLYGKHTQLCIEHCRKITANDSHRFDDIADTMYDAIKIALIDKVIINGNINKTNYNNIGRILNSSNDKLDKVKTKAFYNR